MRKLKRRPAITLPPCLFQAESPGPLKSKLETVMGVEVDSAQGVENRIRTNHFAKLSIWIKSNAAHAHVHYCFQRFSGLFICVSLCPDLRTREAGDHKQWQPKLRPRLQLNKRRQSGSWWSSFLHRWAQNDLPGLSSMHRESVTSHQAINRNFSKPLPSPCLVLELSCHWDLNLGQI